MFEDRSNVSHKAASTSPAFDNPTTRPVLPVSTLPSLNMPVLGQRPTYGRTIKKENGYDANSYTYVPVVIIGAGESGIAMGCRLKEVLGFDQFRIFEKQSGIGGTWWINRYPGVACDV